MKKTIITIILIFAALVLFTGCDAILNAAYPEYDPESGDLGSNSIVVYLEIDNSMDVSSNPIRIAVVPMWKNSEDQWVLNFDYALIQDFWYMHQVNMEFSWLGNNAYRVFAWHDTNNNGIPGYDEPSMQMEWFDNSSYQSGDIFDFRWNEDQGTTFNTSSWIDQYSRMETRFIDRFQEAWNYTDDSGDTWTDASFWIGGPDFINASSAYSEWYNINPNSLSVYDMSYFEWKLLSYDRSTTIISGDSYPQTSFDWNSNGFNIDFNSYELSNWLYDGTTLILVVRAEFTDPNSTTGDPVSWKEEMYINITNEDPGFDIYGPDTIMKTTGQGSYWFDLSPRSSKTIQSVRWNIYDDYWNSVGYNGNWDWVTASNPYSFEVDFDNLYWNLGETYWTDMWGLNIEVEVTYYDNSTWIESRWIELKEASTTSQFYDLLTQLNLGSSYAYDYIDLYFYHVDTTYGYYNWFDSAYGTLDSNGVWNFSRWDVYDETGYDQVVEVYLSDDYGYYSGYYEFTITDGVIYSGSYTEYVYDYSFTMDYY